jgi:hypothetical protein
LNKASVKSSNLVSWGKSKGKKLLKTGCNFSDEDSSASSNTSTPPKPYPRSESTNQQQLYHKHSNTNKKRKLKKGWRRFCCGL